MKDKTIIISGADSYRYNAHLNHQNYADTQEIDYKFHLSHGLSNPFFTKCYAILDSFEKGYEYVLWIDDDAFFIDQSWDCLSVFEEHTEDIIVTSSRPKKTGMPLFNNGIMFIRKTDNTEKLFSMIPEVTLEEMSSSWQNHWGPLEGNDQPRMIYLTQTEFISAVKIIDYPGFNASEIYFKKGHHKIHLPPIAHITGTNKEGKIQRFMEATGIILP
jgi:hypothetical protein